MDWHIFGHDWAVNLLKAHAAGDNLRHAYLLAGPEGVGRRTLATRFAQALNCTNPPEPGGSVGSAVSAARSAALAHPDLSLLVPTEGHKDIRIDQVRSLQHTLALAPYAAKYRIALLPDFQKATDEACNALLKVLEEPPDRVVMLLTADALEHLLPTIISRCEVIRLRPSSITDAAAFLQSEKELSPEQASLLAHLTSGRIGAAIRLADDPDALAHRRDHMETFLELLSAPRQDRFKLAERLTKPYEVARANAGEVIPLWLSFWRDVFVRSSGADLPLVNIDLVPQVDQVSVMLNPQAARALVIAHEEALEQLDANANVRLLLEALMLRWPFLSPIAN